MSSVPERVTIHIQQGVDANQRGDIAAARGHFQEALSLEPDNAEVLLQLGIAEVASSDIDEALQHLRRARDLAPSDPRVHYALGVAYGRCDDLQSAATAYEDALRLKPDYAKASLFLGNLHRQQNRPDRAIDTYSRALGFDPAHPAIFNNLASLYVELGRWRDLYSLAQVALRSSPDFSAAHIAAGLALKGEGDPERALSYFRSAVTGTGKDASAHFHLAGCLHALHRNDEAIRHYQKAYDLDSRLSDAVANVGAIHRDAGDYEKAENFFRQALQGSPGHVGALINLAEIYEKRNVLDQAEAMATAALRVQPDHPVGNRIIATLLRQKGEFSQAIERLAAIEVPGRYPVVAQSIHYELGKLYDQTGQSDQAIENFNRCKAYIQKLAPTFDIDRRQSVAVVERLIEAFTPEHVASWQACTAPAVTPRIAFLIGFPRSGTTLMDQILDSHAGIQVIEERPMLIQTLQQISAVRPDYPANLAELGDDEIRRYREYYMSLLGQYLDIDTQTELVVDKLPLNIRHVGLIHRLFPEAVYILALRHPCDACLSCFMQAFSHNMNMANFYNLDDTTAFYAKVMELWTRYEGLFELDVVATRYEDLVDDLQGNAARLLDALGVEWDPAVLQFNEHARQRGHIRTPSYNQVTRPIYREAVYRWHKYREHFSPYMDRLAPYIERFGYDA